MVHESESAQRDRRHVVDQAGQDGVGLVVGQRGEERILQARHEHGDDEALYRLLAKAGFEYMLIDAGWAGAARGPNESGTDITDSARTSTCPELLDYAKAKNVRHVAVGALDRYRPADGRGVPAVREVGHRRREDRLHGPRRPVDGELVPARGEEGRRAPPDARLSRRVQARRAAPHVAQRPDSRRSDGPGVLQVERARNARNIM